MGWSLGKILKTVVTGGANLIVDKLNTGTATATSSLNAVKAAQAAAVSQANYDAQLDDAYSSLEQAQAQLAKQQSIIKQYEQLVDQQPLPSAPAQPVSSVQPAAESGSSNNLLLIVVVVVVAFILFNRK